MRVLTKDMDLKDIDFREGSVILVDKPLEWTSFDVVNKIRHRLKRIYNVKKIKVGHNGTLDPLATGLLMIFTGRYTKLIPAEENHDKIYTGTVKLGATTPSLDTETEETDVTPYEHITSEKVEKAMQGFIGTSEQEIPAYSAASIGGKRMYKMARAGKPFDKKYKTVVFHNITLKGFAPPMIDFELKCGKGTYVRAFARDLGKKLNTSAYLYRLRRTHIASYSVESAFDVDEICRHLEKMDRGN